MPSPACCHISAAGRLGEAQGCTGLHPSQVTGHVATGAGRKNPEGDAQAGERASGSHTAPGAPSLGLGRVPGIQPSTLVPAPAPPALSSLVPEMPSASPQWSPRPVLNLNDSCPQPSQPNNFLRLPEAWLSLPQTERPAAGARPLLHTRGASLVVGRRPFLLFRSPLCRAVSCLPPQSKGVDVERLGQRPRRSH